MVTAAGFGSSLFVAVARCLLPVRSHGSAKLYSCRQTVSVTKSVDLVSVGDCKFLSLTR